MAALERAKADAHRAPGSGWLGERKTQAVISKVFTFREMTEAHRFTESNEQIGKMVVTVP
jgi:NADPH:quinone reductase-like Zn-dependent oxidoreductase